MAVVGAIRWDAWYSNSPGTISAQAQTVLGITTWRARLPWFFEIENNTTAITIGSQDDIDMEIQWANTAGLNFWAFNEYVIGNNSDLRIAWNLYQASSFKSQMNWCWISDLGNLGSTGNYSSQVSSYVTNFSDPQYQTVLSGRPLWYIIWNIGNYASHWGSSYTNIASMITSLRSACSSANIGNPYIVIFDFASLTHPIDNFGFEVNGIGADAIGFYNASSYGRYSQLVTATENNWTTYAGQGLKFTPTACVGWDRRPFIQTRVPFYNPGFETINQYAGEGTIPQIISHIGDGLTYIAKNPLIVDSDTLLIYAWNEFAEGSVNMLCPNWQNPPPSQLLAALGVLLNG